MGSEDSHAGIKNFAKRAAIGGAVGGTAVVVAGALAVFAVPMAMSTFGSVIVGTGTMHASAAAGGVAANLQMLSAGCCTASAVAKVRWCRLTVTARI
jgi:protein-S-isoprenylcysteine O-methyltransferase Ste14